MNKILNTLSKTPNVKKIINCIKSKNKSFVYGLSDSFKSAVFASIIQDKTTIIITENRQSLNNWIEDLKSFLPDKQIYILPELDFLEVDADVRSFDLYADRINVLNKLIQQEKIIVLTTVAAVINSVVSPSNFLSLQLEIKINDVLEREDLISRFVNYGYERYNEVEHIGQFAVRGGIIDIFPINSNSPIRLEFFDNIVESIRIFDINNKRSLQNIEQVKILPLTLTEAEYNNSSCLEYIKDGVVIFDEPNHLINEELRLKNETLDLKTNNQDLINSSLKIQDSALIFASIFPKKIQSIDIDATIELKFNPIPSFQGHLKLFIPDLVNWINEGHKIFFVLDKIKIQRMSDFLTENKIDFKKISFIEGNILQGFSVPSMKFIVITEKEIFGHTHRHSFKATKKKAVLDFFNNINVGDYVVHKTHGIGKFLGIVSMEVSGTIRDYAHIQYRGTDKIFLPTDKIDMIHKYISVGDTQPKLSRLNSADWARAKAKAKTAVEDIAEKLIDIYARRGNSDGFAFSPDDALQAEFEDACEFELTEDQARTLEEVKKDMEAQKPMDRLICGDVGFGKTEIAIRAAFKAVMNGKQVAVLVPTTVLAYQHFLTFSKRFEDFLPSVDLLSRFRSAAEQNGTIKQLKSGNLDILIGTHAILNSNRVHFKDLGLLIIDEEQRFGVKQKEKFRDLSSGVDVLSLSATPIPRSLHMSLVNARDLSVIETPPAERVPVQTYVVESNDEIIVDAIRRELNRHGQIFFVYNRIETIDKMRFYLQNLVPEAKIITAHGQMAPELLENIMIDFYNGAFDILLTTTIIENGLDISNANTLIVYNADYFGLSQLYQLRGRVGRSSRLAFAYFMFKPDKVITEAAEKRLQAIKDFAQLGSSFNIAMRDLQIRGAGNLLGAQQHGHIAGVGFAVYSQLLQNAINSLRQKKSDDDVAESTNYSVEESDPILNFHINAYFDDTFISNAQTKLSFYQRIANASSLDEIKDLSEELTDRFGKLTPNAQNLVDLAIIKICARRVNCVSIAEKEDYILFKFQQNTNINAKSFSYLVKHFKRNFINLPGQNMFKVKITPNIKKNILTAVLFIIKAIYISENY